MSEIKDWIVRYYASHDDIPAGHHDGEFLQPLVRCRDCRYFGDKVRIHDTYVCNKLGVYMPEDGYCSEGKAK